MRIQKYFCTKKEICVGSGGGSVVSDFRGLQFESSHRQKIILNIYCQLYWNDENKEKRGWQWPNFFKKRRRYVIVHLESRSWFEALVRLLKFEPCKKMKNEKYLRNRSWSLSAKTQHKMELIKVNLMFLWMAIFANLLTIKRTYFIWELLFPRMRLTLSYLAQFEFSIHAETSWQSDEDDPLKKVVPYN